MRVHAKIFFALSRQEINSEQQAPQQKGFGQYCPSYSLHPDAEGCQLAEGQVVAWISPLPPLQAAPPRIRAEVGGQVCSNMAGYEIGWLICGLVF